MLNLGFECTFPPPRDYALRRAVRIHWKLVGIFFRTKEITRIGSESSFYVNPGFSSGSARDTLKSDFAFCSNILEDSGGDL